MSSLRAAPLAAVLALACSSPTTPNAPVADAELDTAGCERVLPDCPITPPSYAKTVAPIFADRCVDCHYTNSKLARTDLSSYEKVHAVRGSVLTQVYGCLMPQDAPLVRAQREVMLEWLVCGAPNN